MKLIQMKCPNCGASLEITTDNKEIICNYCRTPIILDEEIIKVEHNITDSLTSSNIKVAKTYLENFEDYEKAYMKYQQLSEEYPYEPEVWLGLVLCITKKYTELELDFYGKTSVDLELCDEYFDKYLKVEQDINKKTKNQEEYINYKQKIIELIGQNEEQTEDINNNIFSVIYIIIFIVLFVFIGIAILGAL